MRELSLSEINLVNGADGMATAGSAGATTFAAIGYGAALARGAAAGARIGMFGGLGGAIGGAVIGGVIGAGSYWVFNEFS